MKKKIKVLSVITIAFIGPCPLAADTPAMQNAPQAPAHYLENCIDCHRQMVSGNHELLYSRSSSIINDMQSLQQRVTYCQSKSGLNWNRSEIAAVVKYLNHNFYHYK